MPTTNVIKLKNEVKNATSEAEIYKLIHHVIIIDDNKDIVTIPEYMEVHDNSPFLRGWQVSSASHLSADFGDGMWQRPNMLSAYTLDDVIDRVEHILDTCTIMDQNTKIPDKDMMHVKTNDRPIKFEASKKLKQTLLHINPNKPTNYQIKRGKQLLTEYKNKPGMLAMAAGVPPTHHQEQVQSKRAQKQVHKVLNDFTKIISKP